jgi:hypothetical protein
MKNGMTECMHACMHTTGCEVTTYTFFFGQGTVIADTIIDRDTHGKGDTPFDNIPIHLFGK